MSATAFAYRLAPDATRALVSLMLNGSQLAEDASKAERTIYREACGRLGAVLAAAVRAAAKPMTLEAFAAEVERADVGAEVAAVARAMTSVPGAAFLRIHDASLLRQGVESASVEENIGKIIGAALTTNRELDAGAVMRMLDGRGRPKTAPNVVARARELREQGSTYKAIAKKVAAEFDNDLTAEAVRDQLKQRATRDRKKRG